MEMRSRLERLAVTPTAVSELLRGSRLLAHAACCELSSQINGAADYPRESAQPSEQLEPQAMENLAFIAAVRIPSYLSLSQGSLLPRELSLLGVKL